MATTQFLEYRLTLSRDSETGQVVALIPTLDIGDYGADSEEALRRLQEMASFHLECLIAEGKEVPDEAHHGEGLYLRVRLPVRAA